MRVLVTGSTGQLGRELFHTNSKRHDVEFLSREDMDITRKEQTERCFEKIKPDVVINTAAYTAVDKAEEEKGFAYLVNEQAVENLANICSQYNSRLIHISTDFVFDGHSNNPYLPEDITRPLGVYGSSKLAGEEKLGQSDLVLRTSWLYSAHGKNFVMTMLRLMQERDEICVVSDQVGCPTWAKGLARIIWDFIDKPESFGVYHWSDSGAASWYDFAMAIYEEALSLELIPNPLNITPITTDEYPTAAKRPAYSALDTSTTSDALGIVPRHWRESLKAMLLELKEMSDA